MFVGVSVGPTDVVTVGVDVCVFVGVGVCERATEDVTDGVAVFVGVGVDVPEGVKVGVLVAMGVSGKASSCKNVINLYCAEVKLLRVGVSPYENTVRTSFGCNISLFLIKRLSHST